MPTRRNIGDQWERTTRGITYLIEKTATGIKRVARISPYVCPERVNKKTGILGRLMPDGSKVYPKERQLSQSHGKYPKKEPARLPTKTIPLNAPGYRMVKVDAKTYKQVKIEE
jgi:hypothetical protein